MGYDYESKSRQQPGSWQGLSSAVPTVLLLVVLYFAMLAYCHVQDYATAAPVLIFSSINSLLLLIFFAGRVYWRRQMLHSYYLCVCLLTFFYSLVQFIHLFLSYRVVTTNGYVLFHLIVLFVYSLLTLPVLIKGMQYKNR